ncbi:methylmalonyl-CoA epimerase [Thermococci archaeon]|nr:MAG: methylmalonyl-CoA epimerase [Thermococci archaeon]
MISMQAFIEGLYVTVLGVTVVFLVLIILALAMYGIGYVEKLLIPEKPKPKKVVKEEAKEVVKERVEAKEIKIEPRKLAIITAAILAYIGEKNAQLRPLPFKKKVHDYWSLYGMQSQMDEVENFNYELGKW